MIFGLTGNSGSGKSTVSNIFKELGAFVIDADKIYHDLLENSNEMKAEIVENFDVLVDEKISRKKLAEIVYKNKGKIHTLNAITHKYVIEKMENLIKKSENKFIILDVPLLFESGLNNICDKTVGVIADEYIKINRICMRDGISKEQAILRLSSQKNNMFFCDKCDIIIKNDGDINYLQNICKKIKEQEYGTY